MRARTRHSVVTRLGGITPILPLLVMCLSAGCDRSVDGVTPVGGDLPSEAELERFLRRLHLDLTGTAPDPTDLADAVDGLEDANTAADRAEVADAIMAEAEFADIHVTELENRVFGGQSADSRYDLLCGIARATVPACMGCPQSSDPCSDCDCQAIAYYATERAAIASSVDDLTDNAEVTTEVVDRRYAQSTAFRVFFNDPNTLAVSLFDIFLLRPAEPEEMDNAAAMVVGTFLPNSPAGLLFHRHGSNYDDLIDIVFSSEVYREAVVARVFQRYLGRPPTQVERAHFTAALSPTSADARSVIRAVVSSREYFEQ